MLNRNSESELREQLTLAGARFKGKAIGCPWCSDLHPSGNIYRAEDGVYRYKCHAKCQFVGDIYDVVAKMTGRPVEDLLKEDNPKATTRAPSAKPVTVYPTIEAIEAIVPGDIEARYTYTNPTTRQPDLVVIRYRQDGKKHFWQASPVDGGWILKRPAGKLPLYNRIHVARASTVLVVEGEKCVHTVRSAGHVATTSPMGAGNGQYADWTPLAGKTCYLWPDNDEAGVKHMHEVAEILDKTEPTPTLYWIDPKGLNLKAKGDVVDFLAMFEPELAYSAIQTVMDLAEPIGAAKELKAMLEATISGQRACVALPWANTAQLSKSLMPGAIALLCGDPGASKCLSPDTEVLRSDGMTARADEIEVGDSLMGDDGHARIVLSCVRGQGPMYRIVPTKGDPFAVSGQHILHFVAIKRKKTQGKTTYVGWTTHNMSVSEFLLRPKTFQEKAKLVRSGVEFAEKAISIDPYWLGLWLGDGTRYWPEITTPDKEVEQSCREMAAQWGLNIVTHRKPGNKAQAIRLSKPSGGRSVNRLMSEMKRMDLLDNKHIPIAYLTNSRRVRLEVLAGIIDTDGSLHHGVYAITQKNKRFASDIVYLARSLGMAAYQRTGIGRIKSIGFSGKYQFIVISGNVNEIPVRIAHKRASPRRQRKNVLHTGFRISPAGVGPYVSIGIDGNHLHLLGDFTVVHNSFALLQIAYRWHQDGVKFALFELEEDRAYHLNRFLAQVTGVPGLIDTDWVKANPDAVRAAYAQHERLLNDFGRRLYAAPDKQVDYTTLAQWVESRAAEGCRVIAIDPITAVSPDRDVFIADSKFLFTIKTVARSFACTVLLVTHPRKGRGGSIGLDDLSGGSAYQRFSQTVLWLESMPTYKTATVRGECGLFDVDINRVMHLCKCRNGRGTGVTVGMKWDPGALTLAEQGVILKFKKAKKDPDEEP